MTSILHIHAKVISSLIRFPINTYIIPRVDAVFLDHLSQDIRGTNSSAVWRYLIAYKNLLRSIENIGIAVVYGIRWTVIEWTSWPLHCNYSLLYYFRYYAQGNVSQDQYIQFIRHDTLGFEYLDQSKNFAPQVRRQEYWILNNIEYWIMNGCLTSTSSDRLGRITRR